MMDIRQWTQQAVSRIRPQDEREAAGEELLAHYEDHVEALMERGLSKEKARAEALQAMGDPEETAQLLKQAHSPWPHWIWKASRWMLAIAAIILFFIAVSEIQEPMHRYFNTQNLKDTLAEFDEEEPYRVKQELPCDQQARAGDYSLSVYRVQKVHYNDLNGYENEYIQMILCAKGPVTLGSPSVLAHYLEAEDSNGKKLINLFQKPDMEEATSYVNGVPIGRKWKTHYFAVYLWHYDPEADWIDLTYDRNGVQFSMRLDLKGGGGA